MVIIVVMLVVVVCLMSDCIVLVFCVLYVLRWVWVLINGVRGFGVGGGFCLVGWLEFICI